MSHSFVNSSSNDLIDTQTLFKNHGCVAASVNTNSTTTPSSTSTGAGASKTSSSASSTTSASGAIVERVGAMLFPMVMVGLIGGLLM